MLYMLFSESLASTTSDLKEAISIIADNMIKTRPKREIQYRPYRKTDIYFDRPNNSTRYVNLRKLYPDAKRGNVVYIGTILKSSDDIDAEIVFIGNAKVIYQGNTIFDYEKSLPTNDYNISYCPIRLHKGDNFILFMVRCDGDKFEFEFLPSVGSFRMWAKDYVAHIRATSPIECFKDEDGIGISKLYNKEDEFDNTYVYPQFGEHLPVIRFDHIYPQSDGFIYYAYTTALEDTQLSINPYSEIKIFLNNVVSSAKTFNLKKGDQILIKSNKKGSMIGFEYNYDAKIGIPFLKSSRSKGDKWITVGSFGSSNNLSIPYGPENNLQFDTPYTTENWKKVFWKLDSPDDYLRPYMETFFYSQWFYALMVGHYGILDAAKVLDNYEYFQYFISSMQNISKYYQYMCYEYKEFGQPTFLQKGIALEDLDSIGSIGMNLCEFYKLTSSPEALSCIEILASAAKENIPRFEDGTYHRATNMWSDDTFMSCPFLLRLAQVKDDNKYYDEVIRQLLGYKNKLWMKDKQLFSHIYYLDTQIKNKIPWGRGNGWVFVSLSDALQKIPDNTTGKDELLKLYQSFASGIAKQQDNEGLWHQVLTRPDSYQETSCTGMFIIGFCRGIRNGWLDDKYKDIVLKAFNGIISKKIDKTGNVFGVCKGSSCSMDETYYMNLGTIDNDDHGTGIILSALSEMIKIFN